MPVRVNRDSKQEVWFDFLEEDGKFFLHNETSATKILVETPLKLDSSFENKSFDVFFLVKKNLKESDIFQVYSREDDCRIGWLIPTISLSSNDHDFSENIHFLRYAYIGIKESLKKLNDNYFSNCLFGELDTIQFSKIFHEEIAVLIISKETLKTESAFHIDRAMPSFIKKGYVRLGRRNPSEIKHSVELGTLQKIEINYISKAITTTDYSWITELLNNSYAYEENVILRFFFIYQIIELLIDIVYRNESLLTVNELISSKGDIGKTKIAIENNLSTASEKTRIKLLVDKYTKKTCDFNQLNILCNQLLVLIGRKEATEFEVYFYTIRNFIFHQYRSFPENAYDALDDVIQEIISLLPDMLCNFQIRAINKDIPLGNISLNFPITNKTPPFNFNPHTPSNSHYSSQRIQGLEQSSIVYQTK